MSFEVGTRVETEKGHGVVMFCGTTQFADGVWVGVVLDEPNGKNNGSVKGVKYFECEANHGMFVRASQVKLESKSKIIPPQASGIRAPTASRKDASKGRFSPAASPRMTPSSSLDQLKSSSSTASLSSGAKKQSPKEEVKHTSKLVMPTARSTHDKVRFSAAYMRARGSRLTPPSMRVAATRALPLRQRFTKTVEQQSATAKPAVANPPGVQSPDTSTDGVKEMVKKMEESTLLVPAVRPAGMDEGNELEYLRIENKELNDKLENLRQKRKEDKIKLVEYERNRIQLQALLEYKAKMTDAHTELQRKLQEKERELREALASKEDEREGVNDIEEQLELVTLDKEMAEERAEMLQAELDAQKDQIQKLEMDLEILRNEMEQAGGTAPQGNSVQMKQLEQQNEKLREALVKMRDMTGQSALEKQEAMKENEELKDEMAQLVKLCEKMKKDAELAEQQTAELREQVDAAMGSEQMIETLTAKNLDMEEKIRSLEETIEDYETMRDLDEELLETQKESEKDLKEKYDTACGRINDLLSQIKTCGEQTEEYEGVLVKFRKKVGELNEEIQEHKDENLRLKQELKDLEEGNAAPGMWSDGIVAANRDFAEMVESEMNKPKLVYYQKYGEYVKAFLPDNFSKPGGDNDAAILNVLYPLLSQKAAILSELLNKRYPSVPGGMRREHVTKAHKADQWAYSAKFTYLLSAFGSIVRRFGSAVQRCSVERLSRLAQLQMEMVAQERMIDSFFGLLKTNRFDENTSTENLEKGINYFQNVFSVHMAGESFDTNQAFNDVVSQFLLGLNWIKVNIQRVNFFLLPEQEECELSDFLAALLAIVAECEQLSIRSRNRIPQEKELRMTPEIEEQIATGVSSLEKVANILQNLCTLASGQVTMREVEGLEMDRLKEMLQGAVEKEHGQMEASRAQELVKEVSAGSCVSGTAVRNLKAPFITQNYLSTLRGVLVQLADQLDRGTLEVEGPEKKPFPPLLERAHTRKQDAVEAEGLRWQIEKKDNEIVELKKTLRARADDISNYRLRLEMADKKIESSGKADESRVQRLQARCDELQNELKKCRAEFEETMDALQRDLDATEKENAELKERAKNMSKKALLMNLSNTLNQQNMSSAPSTPTSSGASFATHAAEIAFLEAELSERQKALKWADTRIRQLKAQETLRLLSEMRPLAVPNDICGPLTLAAAQSAEKEELDKLLREAESLQTEARKFQIPYVNDPKKSRKANETEERLYYARAANINRHIADVKQRAQYVWARRHPGEQLPVHSSSFKSVAIVKPEEIQTGGGVGIHSDEYKSAFKKLFGNLDEERRAFEEKRRLRPVPASIN
ncbi:Dynactin subunit 1 [Toxocara canis]|uniref:Dynactin subunit 1 n=1 Tax=Toxocara canis TaxID=6265 RepID=A0A0B2VPS5_TOXCA|nr:Dynactin subunit 1 [Toxocara canis]